MSSFKGVTALEAGGAELLELEGLMAVLGVLSAEAASGTDEGRMYCSRSVMIAVNDS